MSHECEDCRTYDHSPCPIYEAEAARTALDALRERVEAEAPNSWLRDRVLRLIDEARPK